MAFVNNVNWSTNDTASNEKLQQMVSNDQYLYSQVPLWYRDGVLTNGLQLKIACGVFPVGPLPSSDIIEGDVKFRSFFTDACMPVVSATLATQDRVRSFVSIRGINGHDVDHTGFHFWVAHQELNDAADGSVRQMRFERLQKLHWIAIGY